eukprot:2121248-Pleurochrysis_carterae.AAC.1
MRVAFAAHRHAVHAQGRSEESDVEGGEREAPERQGRGRRRIGRPGRKEAEAEVETMGSCEGHEGVVGTRATCFNTAGLQSAGTFEGVRMAERRRQRERCSARVRRVRPAASERTRLARVRRVRGVWVVTAAQILAKEIVAPHQQQPIAREGRLPQSGAKREVVKKAREEPEQRGAHSGAEMCPSECASVCVS